MKTKKITSLLGAALFLISASCGSSSSTSTSNMSLSFAESTSNSAFLTRALNKAYAAVTASDSHCEDFGSSKETQQCSATPNGYNLGVLAIYATNCTVDGTSDTCDATGAIVNERFELYNGTQIDVDTGDDFSGDMNELTDGYELSGIQVVTAYIEQTLPNSSLVQEDLRGVTYRICITDQDEIDSDVSMETRCGHEDAQIGDYLIDLDGDGVFGFIDNVDEDSLEESDTRPTSYSDYNDSNFTNGGVCFGGVGGVAEGEGCDEEYTDGVDIYDTAGYFAPLMSLSSVQTVDSSATYDVTVTFNIADTFEWTDGSDGTIPSDDVCVGAISDQCVEGSEDDTDPDTVGTFNIFYDSAFLPAAPTASVSITES